MEGDKTITLLVILKLFFHISGISNTYVFHFWIILSVFFIWFAA